MEGPIRHSRWLLALIAVFSAIGIVRGDDVPWSYHGTGAAVTVGSSSVNFVGKGTNASGDSGLVVFNLSTQSDAPVGSPDHLVNQNYSLNVTFSDTRALGSGSESGTLSFTGKFSADISKGAVNEFQNTFISSSGALVLGDAATGWRKYTVVLDGFTPPGPPGSSFGAIHAQLTITPGQGPGDMSGNRPSGNTANDGQSSSPHESPEPASSMLAGLGLVCLGVASPRARRKR